MTSTGRLGDKVAFITGVARGQGRSHAIRMAEEGADIIGVDMCAPLDSVPYPLATEQDLKETVVAVEATGRRMFSRIADVRDFEALNAALADGVAAMGGLDTVVANAGVLSFAPAHEMSEQTWGDMIDISLTGVWHTVKAAIPHLIDRGSGAIVIISSGGGFRGLQNVAHYCAAKHGVVGLMRSLAVELGPHAIRVNTVHPTNVGTSMILNQTVYDTFRPDLESPGADDLVPLMTQMNSLPIPWVEPADVSSVVVFLASDEARYLTGSTVPIDAGMTAK